MGTSIPASAPLSWRTPGPEGIRIAAIRPGDGMNPLSGSSA
jgi:hypothetical protein